MFDKWFKFPVHHHLYLTAIGILLIGVSTSNALMSIGTILLIANALFEAKFSDRFERLKSNKVLYIIIAFLALSLLSILWSTNLDYALNNLRSGLPFFVIPLVIGTSRTIKTNEFNGLLKIFILTIIFTSVFNYWQFILNINVSTDIREMSSFISHIRYSIIINLGIFITYYFTIKKSINPIIGILVICWLVFYQYKSQTINGYGLFLILFLLSLIYWVKNFKNIILKKSILISLFIISTISVIVIGYVWFESPSKIEPVNFDKLELYTANHNGYYHIKKSQITEDGKLVYIYISEKECKKAWEKRSKLDFEGLDNNYQDLRGTLYRYMTSISLRKDSIGFLSMSKEDIVNVENGFSNYNINKGLIEKISDLKMQMFTFRTQGDPNGHSLLQRIIHFSTGVDILKNNWLFGVGIGDVKDSFISQYEINNSKLNKENRHRAHNQFLTHWISMGLIGFILTLSLFIYPLLTLNKRCDFLLCIVLISFSFSFLWQDMLETQAGVTIFSIFYSLMVFKNKYHVKN